MAVFVKVSDAVRFDPNRPMTQLVSENHDGRVVVFGFEPGQAVEPHTSSSTVLMQVVSGNGRFQVGEEERTVGPGDLAICSPNVPHGLAAGLDGRLVVLVVITPRP
jgi:quercetin dioxygenase-like cupin family protein